MLVFFTFYLLLFKALSKEEDGDIFFLQHKSVQQDTIHLDTIVNILPQAGILIIIYVVQYYDILIITSSIADVVFCSSSQLKTATWDEAPKTEIS